MTQALSERWNGAHWTIHATSGACGPECPGVARALADIACASVSTCVAVGYRSTFQFTAKFAQAWHRIGWATTPTTNLAGSGDSELTSVGCTSPITCVAAGVGGPAFAERWNGTTWNLRGTGPAGTPKDISCTPALRCEIVGVGSDSNGPAPPQAWLENGRTWSAQNPPGPTGAALESVTCPSAADCFAVGATRTETAAAFPLSAPLIDRFK